MKVLKLMSFAMFGMALTACGGGNKVEAAKSSDTNGDNSAAVTETNSDSDKSGKSEKSGSVTVYTNSTVEGAGFEMGEMGGFEIPDAPGAPGNSNQTPAAKQEEEGLSASDVNLPSSLKKYVEVKSVKLAKSKGEPYLEITYGLKEPMKNVKPIMGSIGTQYFLNAIAVDDKGKAVNTLLPSYGDWRSEDRDGNIFLNFLKGESGNELKMRYDGTADPDWVTEKMPEGSNVDLEMAKIKKVNFKVFNP